MRPPIDRLVQNWCRRIFCTHRPAESVITFFITLIRTGQGPPFTQLHDYRSHHRVFAGSPAGAVLYRPRRRLESVLEFFTGQINNDHARRANMNATRRFAAWCGRKNVDELSRVQPFHVAAFIKDLQAVISSPTVKQHLAALRILFDRLVTGHVIDVNSAHAVRGPKYVVKKGKTRASPPRVPASCST